MTTRDERYCATANRDDYNVTVRNLGHDLAWKLAPNATRKGHAYYFVGTCRNCGGNIHIGASWSSTDSVVDARTEKCAGPGTWILTEIEQGRLHELAGKAIADFGAAVRRSWNEK